MAALRYKGRYGEAVELALRTRGYFLDHGDHLQAAKLALNLGTVYRPMGRLADALAAYRQARSVFRRLGEKWLTSTVEQNIGNVLVDLGRYEEALGHLRAAERMRRRLGLQTDLAQTLLNIGILSRRRGDYGSALAVLTEARQISETLGDERCARLVDLQVLPTCVALNLRDESRAAAERAVEGLRRFEMPFELGQALLATAALVETDGELDQARACIDEAREIFGRLGNPVWEAVARLQRARLALAPGPDDAGDEPRADADEPNADATASRAGADASRAGINDRGPERAVDVGALHRAVAECRDAVGALTAVGALDHAAFGRLIEAAIVGRLAGLGLADPTHALDQYRAALAAAEVLHADHLLYQGHAAVGDLLRSCDPDAAVESYHRAVDYLEAVRARTLADDLKVSFLADKGDLYEQIVGLLIERGTPEALAEAYSFVERSKSRTLLEELLGGPATAHRGSRSRAARLALRVRDLRTRLNGAYVRAYDGDAVPSSDSMERSGSAEAVAQLERELAQTTRDLQLAARTERSHVEPTAATNRRLPDGVALVEFYAVEQELIAFVDSGAELRLHRLCTLDEVATMAGRLEFQIGRMALGSEYVAANIDKLRAGVERPLQQLYRAIVAPLESDLDGFRRLVLVPHGPLHGLPFHAFHDGTGYLAERFTIAYAPSAGVYHASVGSGRPIGDRALVVGIEDPGLPWVVREIEAVAAAWPESTVLRGKQATAAALRRRTGHYDVLHLATHGVFRADNPAFSSIKLSDSCLTVNDLAELARGARLVTLSACETGVSGLTVGDEVVGLTRGILAAGCSTVVASLWTVSDESTAHLMAHFYGHLRRGTEPAAALQAAMLALRADYDHPYYWAAFAAVGGGPGRGT